MLLLAVACSTPAPAPTPTVVAPAPPSAERRLQLAIGRARESDERACAAIESAIDIAAELDTLPTEQRPAGDLHGLRMEGDHIRPAWNVLADAIGPGTLSTSLVTVGGISSVLATPCVDPAQLEGWTRRLQAFAALSTCRETLGAAAGRALDRVRSACVCEPVPELTAAKLAVRLKSVDPEVAAGYATWHQAPTCAPSVDQGVKGTVARPSSKADPKN